MKKKIIALILVCLMCFGPLAGCGANNGTTTENTTKRADGLKTAADYKIAVIPKMTNASWFQRMEDGVKEYNKEFGCDVVYRGSAEGADQAATLEQMLAEDWDAICVVPFDSQSIAPVLEKAKKQGIVVITHEAPTMDPKYFDYDIEAIENRDFGRHFAEEIAQFTGGKGKYIQFVGDLNSVTHIEWTDAAKEYFDENTEMELVARLETNDETTSSYNQTKELLQANPDIVAIQGSASTDIVGAAQAVDELGLTGKVAVIGTGLTSTAGNYMNKGVIQTFSLWDPAQAGKAMIELAVKVLNGEEITGLSIKGYEALVPGDQPTVLYGNDRADIKKENMMDYDF